MTGEFIERGAGPPDRPVQPGGAGRPAAGGGESFAAMLARGPSFALGITKDALNREASMDLRSAFEAEAQAQAECMLNPNFREAYEAFRAKRPPRFD